MVFDYRRKITESEKFQELKQNAPEHEAWACSYTWKS